MATLATILNTHLKQGKGQERGRIQNFLLRSFLTPARQIAAAGAANDPPPAAVKICFAGQFYFGEEEEALAGF